jgi:uncharacterized membrane protein YhfC
MVSAASIVFMLVSFIVSIGVPTGLLIYFRKHYHIQWKTVLAGVLVFFIFTQILEKTLHYFVLGRNLNGPITHYPYLFALYGALAAGLFEEAGRWLAFTKVLKTQRKWEDGIAFGLGHGGLEAILIGGLANIQLLVFSMFVNNGTFGRITSQLPHTTSVVLLQALLGPSYIFLLSGLERMVALTIQITLSLVILYGVKKRDLKYLWYAILLHALIDFPAALFQAKALSLLGVETILVVTFIICIIFVRRSKKIFSKI